MDLRSIPIFAMINRKIDWLARNHELIAENIANADTPAYVSKRLKPLDFGRIVRATVNPVRLAQTRGDHMAGTRRAPGKFRVQDNSTPYEVTPTGNSVSLDEEAVQSAHNAMAYRLATTLYRKNLTMLRKAIRGQA